MIICQLRHIDLETLSLIDQCLSQGPFFSLIYLCTRVLAGFYGCLFVRVQSNEKHKVEHFSVVLSINFLHCH
jgi:hypothetical protein